MMRPIKTLFLILLSTLTLGLATATRADSLSASGASLYAITPPPTAPGQSATLLPDGNWLLLGGELQGQPTNAAALFDPGTGQTTALPATLQIARAWQTATVLPDGTVFIFGGTGTDGQPVAQAERYDPANQTFTWMPPTGLTPRAHQIAHVLMDGRVLIAGGANDEPTEIWDPRTNTVTAAGPMIIPRADAESTLLSTDPVLLWGDSMLRAIRSPHLSSMCRRSACSSRPIRPHLSCRRLRPSRCHRRSPHHHPPMGRAVSTPRPCLLCGSARILMYAP